MSLNNTENEKYSLLTSILVLILVILILFIIIDTTDRDKNIKKRLIEKDFASYNSVTGKFEYINKDIKYVLTGQE